MKNWTYGLRRLFTLALAAFLACCAVTVSAQKKSDQDRDRRRPEGTPVLWREPVDISSRNLYLGPGGAALRPDVRKLTFLKKEQGGYSTKFRVRDASGREWVVKVGKEAQSETAAVRLLWAVGYMTEINYLFPRVRIPGQGTFENVRFEARPENVERLDEWKWRENPFVNTNEFQGLVIMMALLNNWDLKDSNNQILQVRNAQTGASELRYIISDLGATFGKTGSLPLIWRFTRSRNNPEDYAKASFIEEVKEGHVNFRYGGKNRGLFDEITVGEAKWLGNLLARLSNRQIRDAFRAANYSRAEVQMLTRAVRARINELVRLPG